MLRSVFILCSLLLVLPTLGSTGEDKTGVEYPTEECAKPPAGPVSIDSRRRKQYWDDETKADSCAGHDSGDAFCESCTLAILCLDFGGNLTKFNTTCEAGTACSGGACGELPSSDGCACPTSSGLSYKPDPYTNAAYITCIDGTAYYTDCPEGQVYDGVSQCYTPITTTTVATTTPPPCTTTGFVKVSCTEYEFCAAPGAPPLVAFCPDGQFFDEGTSQCVDQVPPFTCQGAGSFGDPYDCRRYYICNGATLFDTKCCATTEFYDESASTCSTGDCTSSFDCKPNVTSIYV